MSEGIYELHGNSGERARVLEEATERAKQKAMDAGAAPEGCQVCNTTLLCVCSLTKVTHRNNMREYFN